MLGLALELRCRVSATPAEAWSVRHVGKFQLAEGDVDAVLVAAEAAVGNSFPLALVVDNDIPLARGLGSSSAARAAGAAAALVARDGSFDSQAVFRLVTEFEGHGDNAAAAVFGGLVSVDHNGDIIHLNLHDDWKIVLAIPDYALSTAKARAALGTEVSRAVVVRNAARLVALVEGLRTGDSATLQLAKGDELHEQPRATLHERAGELMAAARRGGAAHAAWSGAGPTIMAFVKEERVNDVVELMTITMAGTGTVQTLDVAAQGLAI